MFRPLPMRRLAGGPLAILALIVLTALRAPTVEATEVDAVSLATRSFNPSLEQTADLAFSMSTADRVWVRVYDPDGGLVTTVVDGEPREAGRHTVAWDGRDWRGEVVPDEAYTFVLETGSGQAYDPVETSGGEVADLTDGRFDRQGGTVSYRLPEAARVLIRLGVRNGPMYKTLVDWKPRVGGTVTEYWDGRDEDGLLQLQGRPGFSALITYVTLPDATVIAYGNESSSYREYKLGPAADRPQRKRDEEGAASRQPEGLVPQAWARAPQVTLSFPRLGEAEVPRVSADEVAVRVEVAPEDRDALLREQFEIILYVDDVFFAEAERGYLPFNYRWEVGELAEGEHVLTINVASFHGQVGVASRKVLIDR